MNLLIGLLNTAIDTDNDRAYYLEQKAEVSKNAYFETYCNKDNKLLFLNLDS